MGSDALIYAYFFVGGALLLLVLLGIVVSFILPSLNKISKQFFISSFSVLALSIATYVIDIVIYTNPTLDWLGRIIAFFETLLPSVLMPLLSVYVLLCCGKSIRKSPAFYLNIAFCASLLVILIVTQLTDGIYYFTKEKELV